MNGRLYMVKVTPTHGVPYYLIDNVGQGEFVRYDSYDAAYASTHVGDTPVLKGAPLASSSGLAALRNSGKSRFSS